MRALLATVLLARAAAPLAGGSSTRAVPASTTLVVDGSASPNSASRQQHTLSGGVGAMSTGGQSRLLIDYAEPYRSQVLDYLFRPQFGASLQHLKVELGGGGEVTSGSEPATMRNSTAEDYHVGYEMWLMSEAKKRNPDIMLYGLPLSWPAWVGNGTGSPYSNVALTAAYVTKWCAGAKRVWNVSVDYIGLWNERPYTKPYILELRRQLDAASLHHVKIVGSDAQWDPISSDVLKDAKLRAAVAVLSSHCARTYTEPITHHRFVPLILLTTRTVAVRRPWYAVLGQRTAGAAPVRHPTVGLGRVLHILRRDRRAVLDPHRG